MTLVVEQAGRRAAFPELQIKYQGSALEWRLKQNVILSHLSPSTPVSRHPSPAEPHAGQLVHGLECSLAPKCATIASTPRQKCKNYAHTYWELRQGRYPKRWLEPVLRSAFNRQSNVTTPRTPLTQSLEWTCPPPPGYTLLQPDMPLPRLPLSQPAPTMTAFFRAWYAAGGHILPKAQHLMATVDPILFPAIIIANVAESEEQQRPETGRGCRPASAAKRAGRGTRDQRTPVPPLPARSNKMTGRKRQHRPQPPPPLSTKITPSTAPGDAKATDQYPTGAAESIPQTGATTVTQPGSTRDPAIHPAIVTLPAAKVPLGHAAMCRSSLGWHGVTSTASSRNSAPPPLLPPPTPKTLLHPCLLANFTASTPERCTVRAVCFRRACVRGAALVAARDRAVECTDSWAPRGSTFPRTAARGNMVINQISL